MDPELPLLGFSLAPDSDSCIQEAGLNFSPKGSHYRCLRMVVLCLYRREGNDYHIMPGGQGAVTGELLGACKVNE